MKKAISTIAFFGFLKNSKKGLPFFDFIILKLNYKC